ncbi:hypothetical protein GCM10022285_34690 [Streptomyces tunisiensis]|uniref:Uncharacterized protein n=1 Tax=Streptomyces tunisiensis TaxID=948699 RepID=A0ABP7YLY3_9ACTN
MAHEAGEALTCLKEQPLDRGLRLAGEFGESAHQSWFVPVLCDLDAVKCGTAH